MSRGAQQGHAGSCCRRVALAATGVVLAGAAVLGGPGAAAAASSVDCSTSSLQAAINNAAPGARLIVRGTCFGNFTIDKNLTLLGHGTAVLDGQNAGTTLSVSSGIVHVTGLNITHGRIFGPSAAGGGISNGGTLTLRDSVVSGNTSQFFGGGISNTGSLKLKRTRVGGNNAGESGAGIENDGTLTLQRSTVSENAAAIVSGGGIVSFGGTVTLDHSAVTGNSVGSVPFAGAGGGIAITPTGSGEENLTLNDSTVTGNTATVDGGGIFTEQANATLNKSKVSGNSAGQNGGGIFFNTQFGGTVTLSDTTVASNAPNNCFPTGSVAGCAG